MIKEKESKQERFPEKRNPNKKDSEKRSTFNQLTGGAFKNNFVTGNVFNKK